MAAHSENTKATTETQDGLHPGGSDACLVRTAIGSIQGFTDPSFPGVKQWLGVPFAEPPVGERRFAPPEPKKPLPNGIVFQATAMPPSPIQAVTARPDFYAKYTPEFLAPAPYSEDCLYLNVYAPHEKSQEPLPTIVFFYGGQGEWGGVNTEYFQPHDWVQRSQKHIVVLFNWRVGILGFPNGKGFRHGPLGILDQRRALEFVRDNIEAFGGSPSKIVAFGSAAGSGCIDQHLFAWPDDPIVSAAICVAGVMMGAVSQDPEQQSFTILARRLGCPENATPDEQLAYLRTLDAGAIQGCFRLYNDSDATPKLFFRPQVDETFFFSPKEQLDRARQGRFAKVPLLLGMTADEGTALVPCGDLAAGKDDAVAAAAKWTSRFKEVGDQTTEYRLAAARTTYRFLYAGDFANVSPRPWMKAYHFAEIPMIMGTHEIERGPSTEFQKQLSTTMQTMWVDFARDPEKGLARWGWEAVNEKSSAPMVLGKEGVLFHQEGKTVQEVVEKDVVAKDVVVEEKKKEKPSVERNGKGRSTGRRTAAIAFARVRHIFGGSGSG